MQKNARLKGPFPEGLVRRCSCGVIGKLDQVQPRTEAKRGASAVKEAQEYRCENGVRLSVDRMRCLRRLMELRKGHRVNEWWKRCRWWRVDDARAIAWPVEWFPKLQGSSASRNLDLDEHDVQQPSQASSPLILHQSRPSLYDSGRLRHHIGA
ncbi:hypothetical protein BCR34DRAFT_251317 [Clohesyomyces aquaticus]|uniref:Uncharacterized protein n=1 Tax=Clohesyomyces aquaticus TaxID=1231657 RepID=A0A1Y1ZU65_9PLEO|nr:hypothetical protein BCR34DRAFT_251317 [Clohesyomyces aquaticus]